MCKSILAECMYVDHTQTWYLGRPQENVGFPGSRVTDGCEAPYAGNQTQILHKKSTFSHSAISPAHNIFPLFPPVKEYVYVCESVPHVWIPVEVKVLEIPRNWTHRQL